MKAWSLFQYFEGARICCRSGRIPDWQVVRGRDELRAGPNSRPKQYPRWQPRLVTEMLRLRSMPLRGPCGPCARIARGWAISSRRDPCVVITDTSSKGRILA